MKTPIPPKSVVRRSRRPGPRGTNWRKKLGCVYRIGYYGENDGLDCIWLVNDEGKYREAIDHEFLFQYYDIIELSDEKDLFGKRRPQLEPIILASAKPARRARKR